VIISDLYDESDAVQEELRRAMRIGHEIVVFQVLTREEVEFPFAGEVELKDLESGRTVLASPASAAAYRREVAAFLDRWRSRSAVDGIDYTLVTTEIPLDRALRSYLLRRARKPVQ
jgi:hypothetical protein